MTTPHKIHIIGGGTFSHVRNHLALAAPAFGTTAKRLQDLFERHHIANKGGLYSGPELHLTKMADPRSDNFLVTNADVAALIERLTADPATRVIILNAALCDWDATVLGDPDIPSGSHAQRLQTSSGDEILKLTPTSKVIRTIRAERKDIFVVGFKTTTNASPDEQYAAALNLLKSASLNLVVANDTVTRHNMIVAPEETRYCQCTTRQIVLTGLVDMVLARMNNTFTRSNVVPGNLYRFQTDHHIPDNLRQVVNHLVSRGAYKPFRGATAGHFAVRINPETCLTSVRKTDYNTPTGLDLVQVEYEGLDRVTAYGAKPSVGGQSQRIIFDTYPDADCIVHAHVPLRQHPRHQIPTAPQWQNECGSHQCGQNTATNLKPFGNLRAVMLEDHGPNIVFSKTTPAAEVIDFIEANFDLADKTGGLLVPA